MEVILGIVGLVLAYFGYRIGAGVVADRSRKAAEANEKKAKEAAAIAAGKAMKDAAAERDREMRRKPTDTINDAMRRGR